MPSVDTLYDNFFNYAVRKHAQVSPSSPAKCFGQSLLYTPDQAHDSIVF